MSYLLAPVTQSINWLIQLIESLFLSLLSLLRSIESKLIRYKLKFTFTKNYAQIKHIFHKNNQ